MVTSHHSPFPPIFSFIAPNYLTALHLSPFELHNPSQFCQFQTRLYHFATIDDDADNFKW
ncbi:predicted protein [Arabidopsis lyrata subsp. lyrata]|uniref:Predicted protein n=1 Tax=Arabidopsis lyrata subsp. lyrata TaxID=81972 RepID=D7KFQ3_ARALL|nr:predicted protein [Arabidopsis lyrata subsp. lyrata]